MKCLAPENEGSFHTVQIWGQNAVSHFIVFKRSRILVKLGMVELIGAGLYIEKWMGFENTVCEPFQKKQNL